MSCALAIGGLDPGGGAGIAADLRAFTRAGVFGGAVVAVLTVQSTRGLELARTVSPRLVVAQLDEVVRTQRVRALKIGALGARANVVALAEWLARHPGIPVVLDPVMIPTRGRQRLLSGRGLDALRKHLLPRSDLVTANAPEAAALTGLGVSSVADARRAALALLDLGAAAAMVKGGHLAGTRSVDVLAYLPRGARAPRTLELDASRLALPPIHGGGCILAALVAGRIAAGHSLLPAVRWARRVHRAALVSAVDVGGPLRVLSP